jgi:hypothetical protein
MVPLGAPSCTKKFARSCAFQKRKKGCYLLSISGLLVSFSALDLGFRWLRPPPAPPPPARASSYYQLVVAPAGWVAGGAPVAVAVLPLLRLRLRRPRAASAQRHSAFGIRHSALPLPMTHGPWPMIHGPWPMAHDPSYIICHHCRIAMRARARGPARCEPGSAACVDLVCCA